MRRNLGSLSLLTAAITLVMISCSRTDTTGLAIPKDAGLVIHINTSSISGKVSWKEIQQTNWFKELYSDQSDTLTKDLLDDPSKTGINLKEDLAFFMNKQGGGSYTAFEGSISSSSDFEAFNKKINKGAGTVSKDGDINILRLKDKGVVAWNSKRFVYVSAVPTADFNRMQDTSRAYDGPYTFPVDSLQKIGVQLFDLEAKNSLTSDDRFAALLKEKGDVHFWASAANYSDALGGVLPLTKLNVLFEGNVSATTLNFDNGKIVMNTKSYYNKELKALMEKYPPGKVSTDLINRIASQNVSAVFAMKYPPAGLKDLMKLVGVDGWVNSFLGEMGYSVDEFVKANKGDLLIAVTDFRFGMRDITIPNPDGEPYTMKSSAPSANFLFATSVGDKAAFDKMITIMKSKIPEEASNTPLGKVSYQVNNEWFVAGNSPEQVNSFLTGSGNKQDFASRISGKAFGGYLNLQQMLKASMPAVTDSSILSVMDASLKMWQDVVFTTGDKKDNAVAGEIEINLVDKNTNSLKQLNGYIDAVSKMAHSHGPRRYLDSQ